MTCPGPRPGFFGGPLRTERDVVEALAGQAVTVAELYRACVDAGVDVRDDGLAPIVGHGTDQRYKRRIRSTLQSMRRDGRASRVDDSTWLIDGTRAHPRHALLLVSGDPDHLELALTDAAELLAEMEGPADLVIADPPWALLRRERGDLDDDTDDRIERAYRRDSSKVVPGYVDVPADDYDAFTAHWVSAAAAALRPGAYLSIITGPTGSARVRVAAEDAGLAFVNQVIVPRTFALPTTRRFSHSHTVVSIMCAGKVDSDRRFFATPANLPRARSGRAYPLDVWPDIDAPSATPGHLRYDNTLPELLVTRIVHALTRGPENGGEAWQSLVVDPFLGGGTSAFVAHRERRRFLGGDVNPHSLRYVMARMATRQPTLFQGA